MDSPRSPPTRESASVVLLLTSNPGLAEELAEGLAGDNLAFELQVVRSLESLREHLQSVHPDAVLLDTDSLPPRATAGEIPSSDRLGRLPIILVGKETAASAQLLEKLGALDHVERDGGCVRSVARALRILEKSTGLEGRYAETVQHYRDILEASSDGIFVLVGKYFAYVNESFASSLKRVPAELIDRHGLVDLAVPDDIHVLQEELARVGVAGGRRELVEARFTDAGGDTRIFEIACRSSVVEGRRAIVGVARDITAERMLEDEVDRARQRAAQIERLRALGELAAGVAHDFNNVLETILGRVALARDKLNRGADVSEDLEVINGAAHNGADTVQRVREFSRPTGSDTWHDVDLTEVVRDAVEFIRTSVPPGIDLGIEVGETPRIRGNGAELREVVLNLLSNALDAVHEHGDVRVRSFTRSGQAVVEVEDTGCGMAPDVQRRVFEPFFSTKGQSGTGLGLSVSHGILRRHDAQILLESKPHEGTRFSLIFAPVEPVTGGRPPLAEGAKAIAVVDDDPSVGDLMQDLLGDLGHDVTVLSNVNDTLSFLADNRVDLLITDLDLDGMSGWHLARSVRQIQPHVVVGLITGWPLGATDDELKTRGVDFVLAKPFSIDALTRALDRVSGR